MDPAEVISRSQPFPPSHVYAIGVRERGVTVASQQRRAIHLIDALVSTGVLGAGASIAVVGAGAAGMTASVRAAHAGCDVVLLERNSELLSTFRGNTTRLLHPNLYSWPQPGWDNEHAQLPILDWKADLAGTVARGLQNSFRDEARRTGLIDLTLSAELSWARSQLYAERPVLHWSAERSHERPFVVVILAVGFGREREISETFPGYWQNDHIEHDVRGKDSSYFIQGAGDGGLTDLLRIRLSTFDQRTYFMRVLAAGSESQRKNLEDAILQAETSGSDDLTLDAFYRSLRVAWLEDAIVESGLRPSRAVLNDLRPAFGRGKFPLNKLLASCLVRMPAGRTEWLQGACTLTTRVDTDGGRELARFVVTEPGSSAERIFDRALLRKGQSDELSPIEPRLQAACYEMAKRGRDTAGEAPPQHVPLAGNAQRVAALTRAVSVQTTTLAIIRALLLNLRCALPLPHHPSADPAFDALWSRATSELEAIRHVVLDEPSDIRDAACTFLQAHTDRPCAVVARALAEALDDILGERAYTSLRGAARHARCDQWKSNALHPRRTSELDPEGRKDGGLKRLALVPARAEMTLRTQWDCTDWLPSLKLIVNRPFDSLDDLLLDEHAPGEFFGARAADPARLTKSLTTILSDCQDTDFLILPEFALHADLKDGLRARCRLFAGVGHVEHEGRRVHQRMICLNGRAHALWEKCQASEYTHGATKLREDIHVASPVVMTACDSNGAASVVIAGAEGWSEPMLELVAQLHPRVLVNLGWESLPKHVEAALKDRGITWVNAVSGGGQRTQTFEIPRKIRRIRRIPEN